MQSFIVAFCAIFAVNSAVHSYLVLRYAEGNKVAVNVGFYYMSNAAGRLSGTILSGVLYSYAGANESEGFGWCFILSAAFVFLCTLITGFIKDNDAGLQCGPLICVGRMPAQGDEVDWVDRGDASGEAGKGAGESMIAENDHAVDNVKANQRDELLDAPEFADTSMERHKWVSADRK
jgi:hypothetical protein